MVRANMKLQVVSLQPTLAVQIGITLVCVRSQMLFLSPVIHEVEWRRSSGKTAHRHREGPLGYFSGLCYILHLLLPKHSVGHSLTCSL